MTCARIASHVLGFGEAQVQKLYCMKEVIFGFSGLVPLSNNIVVVGNLGITSRIFLILGLIWVFFTFIFMSM
jgi:hypothetical protein